MDTLTMVVEEPWSSHAPPTGLSLPLQPCPCTPTNPRRRSPWPEPLEAPAATLTPPLHSPRLGDAFAYHNRAPVPPERLTGELTTGGSVGDDGEFSPPGSRPRAPDPGEPNGGEVSVDLDYVDRVYGP